MMMRKWLRRAIIAVILLLVAVPIGFRFAALLRETAIVAEILPSDGTLVETAMGRVYVEVSGPADGTPVLLVHGSVGWAGFWRETTDALAENGYRAIAFDLAPMGFSDRDAGGDYSRVRQANRILALVDALEVHPVLAAHSFGAGPAAEAAMLRPEAFRSLIVIDGVIGLGSHADPKVMPLLLRPMWMRRLALSLTVTNPLLTERILAMFLHRKDRAAPYVNVLQQPARLEGATEELARWLPSLLVPPVNAASTRAESWRALGLPLALIWGREDTTTPLEQGEALADLVPGSPLVVLDGLGHIPQIEDPDAFQAALLDLLATERHEE